MSVSPYNPSFDEVFHLSSRTPDVSPFRHQPQTYQRLLENGLNTQSPASDVGYGTSFGSQELSGHTLDMDILSNLVVIYNYRPEIICFRTSFSAVSESK